MSKLSYVQIRYLAIVAFLWLFVFFITRTMFLVWCWNDADIGLIDILSLYVGGMLYDVGFLFYALLPLAITVFVTPSRFWISRWGLKVALAMIMVSVYIMLFVSVAEFIFWDEFQVRFNFIAVDYLVYSDEVMNNIFESYPVAILLSAIFFVSCIIALSLKRRVAAVLELPALTRIQSSGALVLMLLAALLGYEVIGQDIPASRSGNSYQRELSYNGPYQFFASFRNNELSYDQFYSSLPAKKAALILRKELQEPNAQFVSNRLFDIRRDIDNPGEFQSRNVVLVTIESLSAKYLTEYGEQRDLSPNLDKIMPNSLNFSHFYATGTRTTRGLEAVTLSIPPTPGRSIVKRIGRESGFASLGQQLLERGYDTAFLYGGRGYFDNMNAFFSGNGYRVIDQESIDESDIEFVNAWGISDEDLYQQAIKTADQDYSVGKPFFLQLMTTSNHRPYTYPEGRIDIPSGEGREGAVKYTDYAIGQFLKNASSKPWFENTLFVFVADHTAGSAGKEDLPVAKYHIPFFIYAPGLVEAGDVSLLSSQIDLAPTLLGLLNMDYQSTFYGRNLMLNPTKPGRALIANYQHLGLFDGTDLAILSPQRAMRIHQNALHESQESRVEALDPLVERDISYYQAASYAYKNGLLRWEEITK